MEARRLVISGLVQGVGYRYSMVLTAQRLGIRGWVRNRRDGNVEALIAGEAEALAAMLIWARRGPPDACVEQVAVELAELAEVDATSETARFEQRPSV